MTNPITQNAYLVANATGTIYPTVIFARAPTTADFNFPITQRWIDTSDKNAEWFLLNFTSRNGIVSPNWVQLSSGGSTTETLSGNTGGPVGPDGSLNINVIGNVVSGISIAGNPGTNTLTATLANIPNSSLANSSITLVAGTDISITTSPVSLGGSTTISVSPNSISLVAGTGISISTSPVALGGSTTISATASANAFNEVAIQVFSSSGTYTPTTGMKYCIVELVGAGGGSGGVTTAGSGTATATSGGGAGGYARSVFSAATIGASQTVTIGTGGTAGANTGTNGGNGGSTSLGVLISATGGLGSNGNSAPGGAGGEPGGTGGAGTGTMTVAGQGGGPHFLLNSTGIGIFVTSGTGGDSFFAPGGAGQSTISGLSFAGIAGEKGSGAGGALCNANSGAQPGAAGGNGYIIITEFISV